MIRRAEDTARGVAGDGQGPHRQSRSTEWSVVRSPASPPRSSATSMMRSLRDHIGHGPGAAGQVTGPARCQVANRATPPPSLSSPAYSSPSFFLFPPSLSPDVVVGQHYDLHSKTWYSCTKMRYAKCRLYHGVT